MKTKFLNTIYEHSMFSAGNTVLVGLSGGADSMCLIHLLINCKEILGISVEAAHINHCIREGEADRDENFVRDFCENNNIPFHCLKVDVSSVAKTSGESIELCARRLRYEFFNSLGADVIATAHTASDRIETMLMNLSRGSSLNGLCSIPAVRSNIVRPLIDITRNEIEEYCEINSIDFVTDSTNLTDEYTRNKFRHNVVSQLSKINPSFEANALRCIKSLNSDNEFLEQSAKNYYAACLTADGYVDAEALSKLPFSMQKRVVIKYIENCCEADYEMRHIDHIVNNINCEFSVMLPGAIKFSCDGKKFYRDEPFDNKIIEPIKLNREENKTVICADKSLSIYFSNEIPASEKNIYVADAKKISDEFFVRSRAGGDVFHLGKRKCSKTLKKLFNELKIPSELRDSQFVLADEKGLIFVENIGVDSLRSIDSHTTEYLIIKAESDNNE
ncbi:MAG: tRNA lysidine(34) synthetase TilS [Clostridia bacterium]|nr:tRNA lysidine(34) synthetase TilS [Clostridia bacterium]